MDPGTSSHDATVDCEMFFSEYGYDGIPYRKGHVMSCLVLSKMVKWPQQRRLAVTVHVVSILFGARRYILPLATNTIVKMRDTNFANLCLRMSALC